MKQKRNRNMKELLQAGKHLLRHPSVRHAAEGLLVFTADQLQKASVEASLEEGEVRKIPAFGENAEIMKLHNHGLLLGALRKNPKLVRLLPAAGTVGFLLSERLRQKNGKKGFSLGESLLLSGALSNLYDRKKYGYVVDYLHVKKDPLSKIVFNGADLAIAAGAFLCSLRDVLPSRRKETAETKEEAITASGEK